jgi:hypothetical protein
MVLFGMAYFNAIRSVNAPIQRKRSPTGKIKSRHPLGAPAFGRRVSFPTAMQQAGKDAGTPGSIAMTHVERRTLACLPRVRVTSRCAQ